MSAESLSTDHPVARAPKARRRVGYDCPAPKVRYGLSFLRVAGIPAVIVAYLVVQALLAGRFHMPTPHWPNLSLIAGASTIIKVHMVSVGGALLVGTILMSGVKGTTLHRTLGWIWSVFMIGTAATTMFIHASPGLPHVGFFGPLHIFSVAVLTLTPLALYRARKGKWLSHGTTMTGIFFGGLIVAGLFTFFPGRLIYTAFFG
jgi:uncharacterized membrane protein